MKINKPQAEVMVGAAAAAPAVSVDWIERTPAAKPLAATAAAGFRRRRLIEIEATPAALTLWNAEVTPQP